MRLRNQYARISLITSLLALTPQTALLAAEPAPSAASESSVTEFSDFAALRTEILSLVGSATKRIWITTDFLTDGEIVSSLYIAQYRKVQIQVVLGKDRASHIMSRLGYLKQVNIPVFLRPRNFYPKIPTLLLIDDKLISVNANLDYLARHQKFQISQRSHEELSSFEPEFQVITNGAAAPDARPLPQVGRRGKNAPTGAVSRTNNLGTPIQTNTITTDKIDSAASPAASSPAAPRAQAPAASGTISADGSYRYRAVKDKPTNGIPTKLPRTTISQDRERQQSEGGDLKSAVPAESP